jgi:ABC-type nitrate/sulfonate/bicarbonate transport system permease component
MRRLDGPVPFRGGGFAPRERWIAGAATLLTLIAFWQFGIWAGFIATLFLPSPVSIAVTLWQLTISGVLWQHLSASLSRLLIGWLAGTIFGMATGIAAR